MAGTVGSHRIDQRRTRGFMLSNEIAEDAKWYVVHTYSGYENKVKANLEKSLRTGVCKITFWTLLYQWRNRLRLRTEEESNTKKYSRYVLVKMIMTDESWYVVRNTRGVTGFVGPGS